jgi:hypothetical protein
MAPRAFAHAEPLPTTAARRDERVGDGESAVAHPTGDYVKSPSVTRGAKPAGPSASSPLDTSLEADGLPDHAGRAWHVRQ